MQVRTERGRASEAGWSRVCLSAGRAMSSDKSPESCSLRLYVAGMTPTANGALANIRKVCEEHLEGHHQIEVVDLLENRSLAEEAQIVVVPTLVRTSADPPRKLIGDLSDTGKVIDLLGITPSPDPHEPARSVPSSLEAGPRQEVATEGGAGPPPMNTSSRRS